MKLQTRYDVNIVCKIILQEQLEKLGFNYDLTALGEVEIKESISTEQRELLNSTLKKYGIEILDDKKSSLVERTKDTIIEMVHLKEKLPAEKTSAYLAEKLNHSYGYLSNLFSEVTHTSIANFIILQKIERVKQLMMAAELTLTEISYELNYSSVAHLSNQFKNITGLTPTTFQRIMERRKIN